MRIPAVLLLLGGIACAQRVRTISPADDLAVALRTLQPGDELILLPGTYVTRPRVSITVKGTRERPVVVRGVPGKPAPRIERPDDARAQNTLNIEGATWLTLRHLEITSNGGDGVNLSKKPSHVTLESLHIHHVHVGVNFRSDMHHITVRRCQIHHTQGTGEGMYVGCNYAKCVVRDCILEGNWIHHTGGSQGDGIEIKRGSHSNVIRDNVIHDTRYPGILLYGTEGKPRNIVEGNLLMRCGDAAIQACADAVIRNNLLLDSRDRGFASQPHQGVVPGNLHFVHNTVRGGKPAVYLRGWKGRKGLVLANNVVEGPRRLGDTSDATIAGNDWQGAASARYVVERDFYGRARKGTVAGAIGLLGEPVPFRPKEGFK